MKLTEQPIRPGRLTEIRILSGGKRGILFRLTNAEGEQLVVKFQHELPMEALAGTRIMFRAGARTPHLRVATDEDVKILAQAVAGAGEQGGAGEKFRAVREKGEYKHVMLMEFVAATTLGAMRVDGLEEFLEILGNVSFQQELGRILAADEFAGNPDRMWAGKLLGEFDTKGWSNPGNLFMRGGEEPQAIAIDNSFAPSVGRTFAPYGRHFGTGQIGSMLTAHIDSAREEAGLLFDSFLDEALEAHAGEKAAIERARAGRGAFVQTVAENAVAAMRKLLERGQEWKTQLEEDGVSEKLRGQFKHRKRMLRLMSTGVEAKAAFDRAKNDGEYRKWVLQEELGAGEEEADRLLAQGLASYKAFKREKLAAAN